MTDRADKGQRAFDAVVEELGAYARLNFDDKGAAGRCPEHSGELLVIRRDRDGFVDVDCSSSTDGGPCRAAAHFMTIAEKAVEPKGQKPQPADNAEAEFRVMVAELEEHCANVRTVKPGKVTTYCPEHGDLIVMVRSESRAFFEYQCTGPDCWLAEACYDAAEAAVYGVDPAPVSAKAPKRELPPQTEPKPKRAPEPGIWQQERWQKAVRADPAVTGTLLLVGLVISTEAQRVTGTHAMISADRIAKDAGMGERQVRRYTKRLQDMGYLEKVQRGHHRGDGVNLANVYDLHFPGEKVSQ
jgi:hypothetical protein